MAEMENEVTSKELYNRNHLQERNLIALEELLQNTLNSVRMELEEMMNIKTFSTVTMREIPKKK